jgi:hypothetical protein
MFLHPRVHAQDGCTLVIDLFQLISIWTINRYFLVQLQTECGVPPAGRSSEERRAESFVVRHMISRMIDQDGSLD